MNRGGVIQAEVLVEKIKNGRDDLFCDLISPHFPKLKGKIKHLVPNDTDAEDVLQQTLLLTFSNLHRLRSARYFGTWMVRIGLNEARQSWRKKKRRREHLCESIDGNSPEQSQHSKTQRLPDCRPIPSEVLACKEFWTILYARLQELFPGYRQVFVLRDIKQLSTAETARRLSLPPPTVKARLLRARRQLRERLAPSFPRQEAQK